MLTPKPKTEKGRNRIKTFGLLFLGFCMGLFLWGFIFGYNNGCYTFNEYMQQYEDGAVFGWNRGFNFSVNSFINSCMNYNCYELDFDCSKKINEMVSYETCLEIYSYNIVKDFNKDYFYELPENFSILDE